MTRDGVAAAVVIDLPYGGTFGQVVKAKQVVASGLDVTERQVFLTKTRRSERRHRLYIADVDPASVPAGRTPLLDLQGP